MRELEEHERRETQFTTQFGKDANRISFLISLVPFNRFTRSALSTQASSATEEWLSKDLGCTEELQHYSLLT